ncbi:hypothetical protein Trydic_g23526 [Trypoxylus dichotomus]
MLLEPPTYATRQRDPTSSVIRKTNRLARVSSLSDNVRKQVTVTEALSPNRITLHRRIRFNPSDILVSFDVVPLFTKVSLIETLRYIADLFPHYITQLFKHCLTTSYFVWDGSFYEHTDGVAMGSLLSPAVANLFMGRFESLAIETAVDKPTVRWRYVNDTFVV